MKHNTNIEVKKAEWFANGHLVMARAEDGSVIQIAALSSSTDAKIVAASKDLLAALRIATEYVYHCKAKGMFGEIDKDLPIIEAALQKATL